jgi:hypothetical protein
MAATRGPRSPRWVPRYPLTPASSLGPHPTRARTLGRADSQALDSRRAREGTLSSVQGNTRRSRGRGRSEGEEEEEAPSSATWGYDTDGGVIGTGMSRMFGKRGRPARVAPHAWCTQNPGAYSPAQAEPRPLPDIRSLTHPVHTQLCVQPRMLSHAHSYTHSSASRPYTENPRAQLHTLAHHSQHPPPQHVHTNAQTHKGNRTPHKCPRTHLPPPGPPPPPQRTVPRAGPTPPGPPAAPPPAAPWRPGQGHPRRPGAARAAARCRGTRGW